MEVKSETIRSTLAKLRCDILPPQRWQSVLANRRFCVLCKDKGKDEEHFLFDCPNYTELRCEFINMIFTNEDNFGKLATKEKFIIMLQKENLKVSSQYAHHCLTKYYAPCTILFSFVVHLDFSLVIIRNISISSGKLPIIIILFNIIIII